jgi:hypothetical protein
MDAVQMRADVLFYGGCSFSMREKFWQSIFVVFSKKRSNLLNGRIVFGIEFCGGTKTEHL